MTSIELLKVLAVFFICGIIVHLIRLFQKGKLLASSAQHETVLLDDKSGSWNCLIALVLSAFLCIEGLVLLSPHSRSHTFLFPIHLAAALLFVGLLLVLRFATGKVTPRFHGRLGYTALTAFAVTLVLGVYFLSEL